MVPATWDSAVISFDIKANLIGPDEGVSNKEARISIVFSVVLINSI